MHTSSLEYVCSSTYRRSPVCGSKSSWSYGRGPFSWNLRVWEFRRHTLLMAMEWPTTGSNRLRPFEVETKNIKVNNYLTANLHSYINTPPKRCTIISLYYFAIENFQIFCSDSVMIKTINKIFIAKSLHFSYHLRNKTYRLYYTSYWHHLGCWTKAVN